MDTEKKTLLRFAIGIVIACMAYFFAVTFVSVPESGKRYADIILGALIGSGFTAILNFYWGSSKGSRDKSEQTETPPVAAPPA